MNYLVTCRLLVQSKICSLFFSLMKSCLKTTLVFRREPVNIKKWTYRGNKAYKSRWENKGMLESPDLNLISYCYLLLNLIIFKTSFWRWRWRKRSFVVGFIGRIKRKLLLHLGCLFSISGSLVSVFCPFLICRSLVELTMQKKVILVILIEDDIMQKRRNY